MKRQPSPEELRLWGRIAATVHPLPGRAVPKAPTAEPRLARRAETPPATPPPRRPAAPTAGGTKAIEPGRLTRIARGRDAIGGRIDLHGLTQDRARAALEAFLFRAWDEGYRAVLVITGKGTLGDGIIRRRAPEWLADPKLSAVVAGISEAHRRHGGEGALYVALKRKRRD